MDIISVISFVFGGVGVAVGVAGVAYAVRATRQAESAAKGSMLGADEAPAIMPVLSDNGFKFFLHNESKYPQFDVWVRVYDFASDSIIDPSQFAPHAVNHPTFEMPSLYPNKMYSKPFFEIDLRRRTRSRVNFFIQTRNAMSSVAVVAIRDDSGQSKIAFKQSFSENREVVTIPADFPVIDRVNPKSLFDEDQPTGKWYFKTPTGLVPAIDSPRQTTGQVGAMSASQ